MQTEPEPVLARTHAKRWIPNDPFFSNNPANAGYQWHLLNTGVRGGIAGVDINVTSVWDTWRGAGIRIAILDDGLQLDHPDLAAAVTEALSSALKQTGQAMLVLGQLRSTARVATSGASFIAAKASS